MKEDFAVLVAFSALQTVSLRPSSPSESEQLHQVVMRVLEAMNEYRFNQNTVQHVIKVYEKCLDAAQHLCTMKSAESSEEVLCGLSILSGVLGNCPRELFVSKIQEISNLVHSLIRGQMPLVAREAVRCAASLLTRLHTYMAAQGMKSTAAPVVGQLVASAVYCLRSGSDLSGSGLELMGSILQCMPQAAKSQFKAVGKMTQEIMCDTSFPREYRTRAASVLASLPSSQNSDAEYSKHIHGLLSTLHSYLSTIPAPATDEQAARAAFVALGGDSRPQGLWAECSIIPASSLPYHATPPIQRLESIQLLLECLKITLRRNLATPLQLPVTPLVLLISRLLGHRPNSIPGSKNEHTPQEQLQLLLIGSPLLKAGLEILDLLLPRAELEPMANAISRLLSEMLLEASSPLSFTEEIRAHLYDTVKDVLLAYTAEATTLLPEQLVACAWAEFSLRGKEDAPCGTHANGALASGTYEGGLKPVKPGKRKRGNRPKGSLAADIDGTGNFESHSISAALQHYHRPANILAVSRAQVSMLRCIEVLHDVASGCLPPQVQLELDIFTISVLESVSWGKHVSAVDPRVHDREGVSRVSSAGYSAAAAMCRSGYRRNVPMAERIVEVMRQEPWSGEGVASAKAAAEVLSSWRSRLSPCEIDGKSQNTGKGEDSEDDRLLCARAAGVILRSQKLARGLGDVAQESGEACQKGADTADCEPQEGVPVRDASHEPVPVFNQGGCVASADGEAAGRDFVMLEKDCSVEARLADDTITKENGEAKTSAVGSEPKSSLLMQASTTHDGDDDDSEFEIDSGPSEDE